MENLETIPDDLESLDNQAYNIITEARNIYFATSLLKACRPMEDILRSGSNYLLDFYKFYF